MEIKQLFKDLLKAIFGFLYPHRILDKAFLIFGFGYGLIEGIQQSSNPFYIFYCGVAWSILLYLMIYKLLRVILRAILGPYGPLP